MMQIRRNESEEKKRGERGWLRKKGGELFMMFRTNGYYLKEWSE
jgi:hypothetical protein